ncbi:amino acid ABC transporter substrate-binding protein [Gleimia hominis]|uniref:Amino acid ABC transporter substrate-binding protein n=1 Tax=Gleimia hominis TaxID=595468 RepID=A0ABU3IAI6_9ACTO|nr:amino acid ABC transporter substrate-binding protein [Gleimia hominis]MDT3767385.1 amino acid ABC transporter substrate-binding protein [Gleimia hominis]
MNKKILAVLSSVLVIFGLVACSNGNHAQNSNSDEHRHHESTFTVGFDASFPPYGFKQDGEYVGFDLDLAQEVAKRQGWELVKQPIDWDSKDAELNAGTVDCLWNGFTMTGREDKYTFSKPYVNNSIVVVVKADSKIQKAEQLAGKNVIVQADSSGLAALKSDANKSLVAKFGNLTEVPEYDSAFMTLQSGAADAVVVDQPVASFQLNSRGADKFRVLEDPIQVEEYGIGFKKGNTQLRDKVQQSLDEMKKDGTFLKLAKKYEIEDSVIE